MLFLKEISIMKCSKNRPKYLILFLFGVLFCGCQKPKTFTAEGVVVGAAGQMLYLEHTGETSITTLDSIKLKSDCKFSFKQPCPEYPDFYRLKLNNQRIHFSVDSTETITFTADVKNFSTSYTVEGSENSKAFKEISLAASDAEQELRNLRNRYGMNLIPDSMFQGNILHAIQSYKEMAKKYIFGAPKSPAAYFALFQQIDGQLFFDLYDAADSRVFGAVATSYKTYYPESPRTIQLERMALESIRVIRQRRTINLPEAKEVSYIDIELPDVNDKNIKLSDIAEGKAVLIVFTAYQTEWSPAFNIELNGLYGKYKDKGFEIYQVSLDNDTHFWKNAAYNIPWICVHDPQSIYSSIAAIYYVRQLPALFLIDSKGAMVKRIDSVETLEKDIKAAL